MIKEMGVALVEGGGVVEIGVPFRAMEDPGMNIGLALADQAQRIVPGSDAELHGDAGLFRPQPPEIDEHAGGTPLVILKVKGRRTGAASDRHLGRRRFGREADARRQPRRQQQQRRDAQAPDHASLPHRKPPVAANPLMLPRSGAAAPKPWPAPRWDRPVCR